MFNTITATLNRYLSEIRNGGNKYAELRNQLVVAADNDYIMFDAGDYKLNTKDGKERLVQVATSFVSSKMIVQSTLNDRGWTKSLMSKFGLVADAEQPNPHYRSGGWMKLYSISRVNCLERKTEIRAALDAVLAKRKKAEDKRVAQEERRESEREHCRSEALAWAYSTPIVVPNLDLSEIMHEKHMQSCILRNPTELLTTLIHHVRVGHTSLTADLYTILGEMNDCKEAAATITHRFTEAFKAAYPDALSVVVDAKQQFDEAKAEIERQKQLAILANTPKVFQDALMLSKGYFKVLPIGNLMAGDVRMHPLTTEAKAIAAELEFPLAKFGKYEYKFKSGDHLVLCLQEFHAMRESIFDVQEAA